MSRSSRNKTNAGGPPPSHPQENFKEHRNFLIRSLERNDVDLAALTELNRSLHKAKESILQSCGELVLIDLGAGRLTLVNDELHEEQNEEEASQHRLTPAQKELCVDFLLRMKLRRKLSNRLARRMNRVAHAMDGEDVAPPPPPKYGDLRLNIHPTAVQARAEQWKLQAEAKQRILQVKLEEEAKRNQKKETKTEATSEATSASSTTEEEEKEKESPKKDTDQSKCVTDDEQVKDDKEKTATSDDPPTPMDVDSSEQEPPEKAPDAIESSCNPVAKSEGSEDSAPISLEREYGILKEYDTEYEKKWDPATKRFKYSLAEEELEPEHMTIKHGAGIGAGVRVMSAQEREIEHKRWQTALLGRIPEQPTFEKLGLKNRVFCLEERRKRCLEADNESPEGDGKEEGEESPKKMLKVEDEEEAEDKDDGEDKDDKEVTGEAQIRKVAGKELRKKDKDEDAADDDKMDTSEKEEPKADDNEKGNAKRNNKESEKEKKKVSKGNGDDGDDSSDMFGDDDSSKEDKKEASEDKKKTGSDDDSSDLFGEEKDETEEDKSKKIEAKDEDSDKMEEDGGAEVEENDPKQDEAGKSKSDSVKDKEEEEKKEDLTEDPPKRIRPMSLAAVPSFYAQDLARVKMIHGDLLSSSILEHARRRLLEVTKDYNNAFKVSNELFDHRQRLQQSLSFFIASSRSELAKVTNDHALAVAIAKQRWLKQKREHDMKRAKSAMPSNWGRPPFGTNGLQNYIRTPGIPSVVGTCLADVIDGSIMIAEGKIPNKKLDDFVSPPAPGINKQTGESLAQQQMRMEGELRRQMNDINAKFGVSEEERKRGWKKMMKTKAELELPHQPYGGARRGRIDLSNYHQIPVPPLRNSVQQSMPRELEFARAAVATYTPPSTTTVFGAEDMAGSESKYSAARVRERISRDGTVAPVSEPKKTKDGLYQRPAGRTRKGMQWDAIRGIWVPDGSL